MAGAGQAKYRPYPAYKPSGVEWLGDIPEGWRALRGKNVFREINERSVHGSETLLSVSEYYGVKPRSAAIAEGEFLSRAESLVGYKKCNVDDLVMNIMLAWKRGLGVSRFEGIVSPAYSVFRFRDFTSPQFMHYLLRTDAYVDHFKSRSTGVIDSRLRLYPDTFADIKILIPPLPEQTKIAAFLDHETAKIDGLIAKQQRLIALLEEKRQAVISHAVTKGLDPTAPQRPSGIDWLGDVPAHWEITKLSHRYEVMLGKMLDKSKVTGRFLGHYLRNTDVQWDAINTIDLPKMDFRADEIERYSVIKGDLLVCEGGEVGRCAIWHEEESCFYQKALHRVRPIETDLDLTQFFLFSLTSSAKQGRFTGGINSATIAHLPAEAFREYKFVFPPLEEQKSIAKFLSELQLRFDALVRRAQSAITLLKERRTALISAAVTGKIDLRDWQPPEGAQSNSIQESDQRQENLA